MTHIILVQNLLWPNWKPTNTRILKRSVFQRSVKRNNTENAKRRQNEIPGKPNTLFTISNKLIKRIRKRKKTKKRFSIFLKLKKNQIELKILRPQSKNCPRKIDVLHYRADMVKSGRLKYLQIMKWSAQVHLYKLINVLDVARRFFKHF